MTGSNANNWQQIVINWGIRPETASHFALRFNGHGGLVYPTLPGHRARVLTLQPAADLPKNFWDTRTAHLPMPPLFNIPGLDVPEARQRVYITNGEKSTMALHSAGIPNAVNTFGENNGIDRALTEILAHPVSALYLAPDCDRAGLIAAKQWQRLCRDAGIDLDLRDLRLFLEQVYGLTPEQYKGFDLRDVWLRCGQNPRLFQMILDHLPPLDFERYRDELPRTKPRKEYQPRKRKQNSADEPDLKVAYTSWRAEVVAALDRVSPLPGRGQHRHCPNPHHADQHPSFRITKEGAPVCTCEPTIPWDMLAGWVGVPLWDDYKQALFQQHRSQKIRRSLPEPEQLRHFPRGIPDALREALLGLHRGGFVQDHAAALVVYEVWHSAVIAAIWPPEQLLSIEMLVDHAATTARHSTEKTVRKGVMQLSALGFFAPGAVIHSRRGRPIQQYQAQPLHLALPIFIEHVCRRLRERTFKDKVLDTVTADWFVGQPPAHAAVLARMENDHREQGYGTLAQEYERTEAAYQKTARALHFKLEFASLLTAPVLELTPDRTWEHGRAYRQAYYKVRAMQRYQHHAAITRTRAAQQVGVSHKTLKVIQKRESIAVDPQFITLEVRQVEGLMDRLNRAAPWARRYHYGRFLENSRGQRITVHPDDTDEHLRAWVEEQFKAGEGVAARVQIAGKERPATAEEIQAFQKRLMPPRRAPVTISARELPPREELSPPHLSLKYRVMQLMMGGRKADEAYTLLGLSHFQPYLFPDFPYSSTVSGRGGGKKGNKSAPPPPGADQPPDRSAPP